MNTTPSASNELRQLKTPKEALVYFIKTLDAEMIDSLLDDAITYQEMPKYQFMQKLEHALDRFINAGDEHLYTYLGTCKSNICEFGCKGIRFIGNQSGLYMDLIIKEEDGRILDVYECHSFSTVSPEKSLEQKVLIDTSDMPEWFL